MNKYINKLKDWKNVAKVAISLTVLGSGILLYNSFKKEDTSRNNKEVFIYTMKVDNSERNSEHLLREFPISNGDVFVPAFYEFKRNEKSDVEYKTRVSQKSIDLVFEEIKRQNKKVMPYIYCQNDKSRNEKGILEEMLLKPDESIKQIKESFDRQKNRGNKYDGVIIDYESGDFDKDEKNKYSKLLVQYMQKIKKEMGNEYKIGIAVGMNSSENNSLFNYKELGNIVDYVHIMCYDYTSPDLPPGLPRDKLIDVLDYSTKEIPRDKITILFATYGTKWATRTDNEKRSKKSVNYPEGIDEELSKGWKLIGRNQGELEYKKILKKQNKKFNLKYFTFDQKTFEDRFNILDKYKITKAGIFQHVARKKITDRHMMIYTPLKNWKNKIRK